MLSRRDLFMAGAIAPRAIARPDGAPPPDSEVFMTTLVLRGDVGDTFISQPYDRA